MDSESITRKLDRNITFCCILIGAGELLHFAARIVGHPIFRFLPEVMLMR